MDVKKENQIETKKRSAWVLTCSRYDSGQRSELTRKVYGDKPTLIDLAGFFQESGDEISYEHVMSALVFLDNLINGHQRAAAVGGWYTLKEVTES